MECFVCLDAFDLDSADRRPKVLPCGHSFCLRCLLRLQTRNCPMDNKAFFSSPETLPDNFLVIQCNNPGEAAAARLWCRTCKRAATDDCVDEHSVCTAKKARLEDARPLVESLQRGEAALASLVEALDESGRAVAQSDWRGVLEADRAALAKARAGLLNPAGAGADSDLWEEAKAEAARSEMLWTASQILADPSTTLSLTIRSGAAGGVVWRGTQAAVSAGPLRMMLCELAYNGELQKPEEQPSEHQEPEQQPFEHQEPEQQPSEHQEPEQQSFEHQEPQQQREMFAALATLLQPDLQFEQQPEPEPVQLPIQPAVQHPVQHPEQHPVQHPVQQAERRRELTGLLDQPNLRLPEHPTPATVRPNGAAAPRWPERPNEGPRDLTVKEMAARMQVGARVARGRDWPRGWTFDGNPPGPGTVTMRHEDSDVAVRWDHSAASPASCFIMGRSFSRLGDGVYHLRLLAPAPLKPQIGGEDGAHFLDVRTVCPTDAKMSKVLTDASLSQVRFLAGLPCGKFITWSEKVLQRVAPRLEGLQLVAPLLRHLAVVLKMPHLQAVSITDVTDEALQMVCELPSLRSLDIHCTLAAPLAAPAAAETAAVATPGGARLRWLRCGVYPLAAALALARAHAATLEELHLVAAASDPYGCPDLAAELRRCDLRRLARLVLVRETAYGAFCRHDAAACSLQRRQLALMFAGSRIDVEVVCSC